MNVSVLQIYYNVFRSCLHHARKVVGILCVLSICTMYRIYFDVSGQPGQFTNRRELITNPHRWNALQNVSHEKMWPRTVGETDDRILSQLRFMDYYASLPANRTMKRILRVGLMNFEGLPEGQEVFVTGKCPIQECSITSSEIESHLVDALLISEMSYFNWLRYLPKPPHQLWIAQHWESAVHDRIFTWLVGRYINWTVSYRRDSTLGISYGKYARMTNMDISTQTVDYSKGKVKQVAWLVSNCHAKNNRFEYAHELAKYIEVDIYGYCGTLTCNRTGRESCHNRLVKYYRFFLAFENSNCKDYITEKLYHAGFTYV